jgi:hypothetical protein
MRTIGLQRAVLPALIFAACAMPAGASTVSYTCDPDIDADSGVSLCAALQTTVAGLYNNTFSNTTASIYIQYGNNGGLGGSSQSINSVSYPSYRSALASHEGPGDANDVTAVASLPSSEPATFSGGNVYLSTALAQALGFTLLTAGMTSAGTFCSTPGVGNCYNGVITINDPTDLASETGGQGYYYRGLSGGPQTGSEYDFFTIAEHETDEILGTLSCIGTSAGAAADVCGGSNAAAADLFRYSAAGNRTFVSGGNGGTAYFSLDGGNSIVTTYNNTPDGQDFGDWSTSCQHVQDATGCPGQSFDITNDGRPEIIVLDALGYNLNPVTVPEPGTIGLLGAGLALLAFASYRRRPRTERR